MKDNASQTFIQGLPSEQRELAADLVRALLEINPEYRTKRAWGGFGFKLDKNYSCLIAGYTDYLKLMIWRGVDLPDPESRLAGTGTNTRHLKFHAPEDLDREYLRKILEAQFQLYRSGVRWEEAASSPTPGAGAT